MTSPLLQKGQVELNHPRPMEYEMYINAQCIMQQTHNSSNILNNYQFCSEYKRVIGQGDLH